MQNKLVNKHIEEPQINHDVYNKEIQEEYKSANEVLSNLSQLNLNWQDDQMNYNQNVHIKKEIIAFEIDK